MIDEPKTSIASSRPAQETPHATDAPLGTTVKILTNPFEAFTQETVGVVSWGKTVEEALPERVRADPDWTVIENGRVLSRDEWGKLCAAGGELICYRGIKKTGLGTIIAGYLVATVGAVLTAFGVLVGPYIMYAGIAMMAGGVAQLLIGPPKLPPGRTSGDMESSPTYGFSGVRNSVRVGARIPVVYGTHKVGGVFIAMFVRPDSSAANVNATGTITWFAPVLGAVPRKLSQRSLPVSITGSGTLFTTEVKPGEWILAAGQFMQVLTVTSNTEMTALISEYIARDEQPVGVTFQVVKTTLGGSDVLHLMTAVSEGEVQAITDIKVNGQNATIYTNLATEVKLGTNDQTPIFLFGDNAVVTTGADAALTESFISFTTVGRNITAFEVNLTFPNGLYQVADDGSLVNRAVSIELQYRVAGGGGFTSGGITTFLDSKRATLRKRLRVEGLAANQWEIQVRRTTPESTDIRVSDSARRTSINEIVNDAYSYPNTAILAVKVLATDQLSGGAPTVTALVQGVKIKIFSAVGVYSIAWSDNPAWVVFDMLTNERYGMGNFVWPVRTRAGTVSTTNGSAVLTGAGTTWLTNLKKGDKVVIPAHTRVVTVLSIQSDTQFTATANYAGATASGLDYEAHRDDLDIQSFMDWAAFCDVLVDNGNEGTEKRATCNIVFDADGQRLWDAVNKICGLGLATAVKLGNYIRIKFQQDEVYRQLFTIGNIVRDSFKEQFMPLKERANYFEVAYLNAANDYEQEMVVLEDPLLFTNAEPERKQTVSVYGVTRSSHAARLARFYQRANRLITRTIQFDVGLDALAVEPGDVIAFQHDIPQWGYGSRIAPGSTSTAAVFDGTGVTIPSDSSWQLIVRHQDDTFETKTVTGPGTPDPENRTTTALISGTFSTTPVDGEVCALGPTTPGPIKKFRVVALERLDDFTARITAVEHDAQLYDETGLTPVNIVNFSLLPDPAAPPAHVTDLVVFQVNDHSTTVMVTFAIPTDARFAYANILVNEAGRWVKLGESSDGAFLIPNRVVGETLVVKVVSVSRGGGVADINQAPFAVIVVAPTTLPPHVTGLELVGQGHDTAFVGRDAKFQWRDRSKVTGTGAEGFGAEVFGAGAGQPDPFFKNYRVEIYNVGGTTLRRREFVVDPFYTYSFEKNFEDAQRSGGVDAVSVATNESPGGNAGVYTQGPILGRDSALSGEKGNPSVEFDGVDDYVACGSVTHGTTFTVECWAKSISQAGQLAILSSRPSGIYFGMTGGQAFLYHNTATPPAVTGGAGVNDGAWHHLVWTSNGTTTKIYIDGIEVASTSQTRSSATGILRIGSDAEIPEFFQGQIDEVALYPTTLNGTQVSAHYAARTGLDYRAAVLADAPSQYWRLGEPSKGLVRHFMIKIWQQDTSNQMSALPATLSVSNLAPAVPTNLTLTPILKGLQVKFDPSPEIDVVGYQIHRSTINGFNPDASTLVYDGPDTMVSFDGLDIGTPYYAKVAAYDTFGKTDLIYSGQMEATPVALSAVDITGVIASLQANLGLLQVTAGTVIDNAPVAGKVAWSGIKVLVGGVETVLMDGNSANPWLYWSGGTTLSTSAVFPALGNDDFLIGWNNNGTFKSLWNNFFKSGVITGDLVATSNLITVSAQIANALILTAHIANAQVTTAKIADAQITTAKILDAAITTAKIADAQITNAKIGALAVDSAKIASAAIQTAKIEDLTVTTLKIANNAVTNRSESLGGSVVVDTATYEDLATVTVVTNGGSVIVFGRVVLFKDAADLHHYDVQLTRDSTQIDYLPIVYVGAQDQRVGVLWKLDAPAPGTYTYKLQARKQNSSFNDIVSTQTKVSVTEYLK